MAAENPFETRFHEYDAWYDEHSSLFESELRAIRSVLPLSYPGDTRRVEIGVGSGRFAQALEIPLGVEPAGGIATLARARGIEVLDGRAEDLPLPDASLDYAFLITVLCFIEDVTEAFTEIDRILAPRGRLILAFLPADSPLGRAHTASEEPDTFLRHASLRTRRETLAALSGGGFRIERSAHTLTSLSNGGDRRPERPSPGWVGGSFAVISACRQRSAGSNQRP